MDALQSNQPAAVANSIYEIGESRVRPLAQEILRVAESLADDIVTEQAVWALGKLLHRPATDFVIRASESSARSIRRAAYWALGELGGPQAVRRLNEVDRTEQDRDLGMVIGGALKKLRGGTVRAPASKVMKRAQLPTTSDATSGRLLESLEAPTVDHASLVRLREDLLLRDPDLFKRYMAYVREKKRVARVLETDAVYRDNF